MSALRTRTVTKDLTRQLERAGFVSAHQDVLELIAAAGGDLELVRCWAERRLDGEPLAWLTGFVIFAGSYVRIDRGVYVPRPQTEALARRAVSLLPAQGLAADLATGSGAIAVVLRYARPSARVVATDIDPDACRCARSNDVEVYQGNLDEPLPVGLAGRFDVVTAVVPYVPTEEMAFLPRDVQRHEPTLALDGGPRGVAVLEQAVRAGSRLLHSRGALLLELGADQDGALGPVLDACGFTLSDRIVDDDGDLRGIHATRD
jgi:release factor glutamine methyltransferase